MEEDIKDGVDMALSRTLSHTLSHSPAAFSHTFGFGLYAQVAKDEEVVITDDVDMLQPKVMRSATKVRSRPRLQSPGFRVQDSGFRIQGSGSRVQGPGFRVKGSLPPRPLAPTWNLAQQHLRGQPE